MDKRKRQHNGQKKKTTQWTKEKDRRTDNTMTKRKRQKNRQHTDLLSFSFGHCVVCSSVFFFCSLCCLFFCLFLLSIVLSVLLSFSFVHCVVCSSVFFVNGQKKKTEEQTTQWPKEKDRRTDNTMA
jgi:Flp pilus assembly protein TadB